MVFTKPGVQLRVSTQELLAAIDAAEVDVEVANEVAAMGDMLRDPADRAIVATVRVHRLRLVISDQRIIDSKLVPVVE